MGLYTVFESVRSYMPIDYPVTFEYQSGDEDKHARPRRVNIAYESEAFVGPRGSGATGQPRALWTRISSVAVYLWGNDFEDTEVLLNRFVAALHDAAHGSYSVRSGKWHTGGATAKGTVYELLLELQIPVTREPERFATITEAPLTAEFDIPTTTPVTEP